MSTGLFITFEGPEGAGKSVQVDALATWFRARGSEVVTTREPGGTALGNQIRAILLRGGDVAPMTEALLLSAARYQHVRDVIRPALDRGAVVISDRYADSTLAYQGGGHGLDLASLRHLQELATDGLAPDLRILLDVPVAVGLARRFVDAASVNRIDRAPVAFHERVRSAFLRLAADDPAGWAVVDGMPDVATVSQNVHTVVHNRLIDCRV